MAEGEKTCFIIMPITTPEAFIPKYRDGADHFRHVLECLFIPGVEKAGYAAAPPIAKGSDLIHAEIIRNLESADLVLCDMSCLNPNVFFEFGIRTSVNKPVCVVKDELTKRVPFDTGILNHQEYASSLDPWQLDGEITKLADHLRASEERSEGQNTLWRYFGLRFTASPYEAETGADGKLDYLTMQMDSLREKVDGIVDTPRSERNSDAEVDSEDLWAEIQRLLPHDVALEGWSRMGNKLRVNYSGNLLSLHRDRVRSALKSKYGVLVRFQREDATVLEGEYQNSQQKNEDEA